MEEVDCFSYMFSQLHDFMRKGLFTDVTFVVGETTVPAHKVVLASSSSVFRRMFEALNENPPSPQARCFQKKKREEDPNCSNMIVVKDTDEDCFVAFIDYLYCRDIKIVQNRAKEMIRLAHRFKIQHLLPLCDSFIQGSLTNETAVECLLLADQCERFDLKKIIKSYIKNQLEFIMASETWHLLESKFELTTEIIEWDSKEYYVKREHMDEVTWTLCNDAWKDEKKEDIMETRGVMIISPIIAGEPKIDIFLSFYCRNNSLVVVGYSDYCFRKQFPLTFTASIKDMKTSHIVMEKKVHVDWKPAETDGTEIMTLAESLDFHFRYPLSLRVSVHKTPVISQHPCLRGFNFYEIRKRFTDVVIRVDKSDFHLHKLVLASKSEYFAKLFENDLVTCNFTDIDVCSFTCLVNYMYSCIFPPPASVDLRLLEGAQKYRLAELSEYCITILIINLGVTNVVEIYIQADNMGIDQLKSAAVDFIANNREKVVKSLDWKNMKDYPHLLKELLSKISLNERDDLDLLLPTARRSSR